jgi:myosin heavy subunit
MAKNHKNAFFTIPKSKKGLFQINHSCSSVVYNAIGMTGKNKDELPRQLFDVFNTSNN